MTRVLLAVLVGMAIGFLGTYFLGRGAEEILFRGDLEEKRQKFQITGEYEAWYGRYVQYPLIGVSLLGGFLCGALCGKRMLGSSARPNALNSNAHWDRDEQPLNREEFQRVLQCCLFTRLPDTEPAFVKGVIVGRLADSDPELARRVLQFSPRHMHALWTDLVHSSGVT